MQSREERLAKQRAWRQENQEKRRAYRAAHAARIREQQRAWREAHAERRKAYRRMYYQEHGEEERAYSKAYRENKPDTVRAIQRTYRQAHLEKLKARNRENYRKNAEHFRERSRQRVHVWKKDNPDKVLASCQARRAKKKQSTHVERFSAREIFERDGWRCQACGITVRANVPRTARDKASLDHIVPLAQGGEHRPKNVQCLCLPCNVRKRHGSLQDQTRLF